MKTTHIIKYQSLSPWLLGILVSLLAGTVASTGDFRLVALFFAALCGLVAALFPVPLFWLAIIVSFALAGLAQLYYPPLELIRWTLIPISAILVAHILIQHFLTPPRQLNNDNMPLILWLLLAFILVNVISAIVNLQNLATVATGLKGYFQLWGLLFAMALLNWNSELMERWLPRAIWILALIQVPFGLHQYFFVAPVRHGLERGIVPLDIVSGTFGGSLNGGGANAVLAVFMFIVWSCVLALWKSKVISTSRMLLISAILLAPVMINEAKVSIVYIVTVFLVTFRRDAFRNITRFLTVGILTTGIVATMFVAYVRHAPEGKVETWYDLVTYTLEYNLLKDEAWGGKLSRGGILKLWIEEHGTVANTLLGYGVGATRSETPNLLSRRLGIKNPQSFGIGNLAVIAILWESGVIGFAIIAALFVAAFRGACKLERIYAANKEQSAIFLGLQGAIVILYISLWHKNFFVFHIGYQAILVVLLGYLTYWLRQPGPAGAQALSEAHR